MELENLENITKSFDDTDFTDLPKNRRAKEDFKYLCNKTNYSALNNVKYLSVNGLKKLGDFLVLGYSPADKMIVFPQDLIDVENRGLFVAVVVYNGDRVNDVLIFKASEFKKPGMFSMFKNLKKSDEYAISLGDASSPKLKEYSFGLVLKSLE